MLVEDQGSTDVAANDADLDEVRDVSVDFHPELIHRAR
jgi:hypothetical protein